MDTSLKQCPSCGNSKNVKEFGTDGRTGDGLTRTCFKCREEASKVGTLRLLKKKEEKIAEHTADKGFVELSETMKHMIKRVTPLYQYLIALEQKNDIIEMPKSSSEIVEFFRFKPRVGIDLVHRFINRTKVGYIWINKPKSAKDVAEVFSELIKVKDSPDKVTQEVLFEQFMVMREELAEMTVHLKKVVDYLEK